MTTAAEVWNTLDSKKQALLTRCIRYAQLTIPSICLPVGVIPDQMRQNHDFQSYGSQSVNSLTNKIVMTHFAPSRPTFRLQLGEKTAAELEQSFKVSREDPRATQAAATIERLCVKRLDSLAQRPKLYSAIQHLIVTGNCLMVLEDKAIRVFGLKSYCVNRNIYGLPIQTIIKETIKFNELTTDVQNGLSNRYTADQMVDFYKLVEYNAEKETYNLSQWVGNDRLPVAFDAVYDVDDCPYVPLYWKLADDSDYGTGLVEEYSGDLEAASLLAEAVVDGAILGTEMRWVVNPSGQTNIDDFNESKNGSAIPGQSDDVKPVSVGNDKAVATASEILQRYQRNIGLAFLMQTAVTRDAERVTSEEIRMNAQELEMSYGGVYSSLGNQLQRPIANWLIKAVTGKPAKDLDFEVVILTGLDALSRNGDLDNLRMAFSDLAMLMNVPQGLQDRIKFSALVEFIGQGRNVNLTPFVMSDEEYGAKLQAQQQARVNEQAALAAGQATAQNMAQPA